MRTESRMALFVLGLCWPLAFLVVQFFDPIPQDPAYHAFADTGSWCGLPNFWNVTTNLALVIAGVLGLRLLRRQHSVTAALGESIFFLGLILTGIGSAYYHYAPNNQTLLWDRLPMTIAFMALFVALLGHCFERKLMQRFLPLALLVGAASVLYWFHGESRGAGDLRYYAVVQFLPMLLLPIIVLRWPPATLQVRWLWIMLLLYVAAKLCEFYDVGLAAHLPLLFTGHALKHLFAGAAGWAFMKSYTNGGVA